MAKPGTMSFGAIAASAVAALLVGVAQAHAQVTGRQLLDWCQGALGASVTATFDAFQCTAYLQAILDQQQSAGVTFSQCLGRAQPAAGDLMARIVPALEARSSDGSQALRRPANEIVTAWIAEHCRNPVAALAPAPASPPSAGAPASAAPPAEPSRNARADRDCRRYYDNVYVSCATSYFSPCLRDGFPFLGQGRVNWRWIRAMMDNPHVDFAAFRRLCETACGTNVAISYEAFRAAVCHPAPQALEPE